MLTRAASITRSGTAGLGARAIAQLALTGPTQSSKRRVVGNRSKALVLHTFYTLLLQKLHAESDCLERCGKVLLALACALSWYWIVKCLIMYQIPCSAMSGCGRAFESVTAAAQPWSVVLPVLLLFLLQLFQGRNTSSKQQLTA